VLASQIKTDLTVQDVIKSMSISVLADRERSASPAIAVILMAAVAIITSVAIGAFVLSGGGNDVQEPSPVVSIDIDREPVDTNVAGNERIIISHDGGDSIKLSDLRITTEAVCFNKATLTKNRKAGTLVNLPGEALSGLDNDKHVRGNKIYETAPGVHSGRIVEDKQRWTAGGTLRYQIDESACDIREEALTRVEVIHKPSNSILSSTSYGTADFQTASPADASYSTEFGTKTADGNVLTVEITDGGQFPPESVYMDVTVEDDEGDSITVNDTLVEWDGRSGDGSYGEIPEDPGDGLVGAGDRVGVDLTSGSIGSGPDPSGSFFGYDALEPDTGQTTDITVKIKYRGNVVTQMTEQAVDFGVDPSAAT
jgi:hypothetical protein